MNRDRRLTVSQIMYFLQNNYIVIKITLCIFQGFSIFLYSCEAVFRFICEVFCQITKLRVQRQKILNSNLEFLINGSSCFGLRRNSQAFCFESFIGRDSRVLLTTSRRISCDHTYSVTAIPTVSTSKMILPLSYILYKGVLVLMSLCFPPSLPQPIST